MEGGTKNTPRSLSVLCCGGKRVAGGTQARWRALVSPRAERNMGALMGLNVTVGFHGLIYTNIL